jgi:hypothetical protein
MNDDRWIETVRDELRPEPLTPARAAALRRELDERIAERPTRRFALPALAAAAAAALVLWLGWPVTPPVTSASAEVADVDSYSDPETFATDLADRGEYLPADYQALALLLEDDAAER